MGTLRKIGRAIDDAIFQPIKNTVEAIVEDPKKLAMVAISVFAPGVGTAIGTSLGLSGTAATIVGNAAVNTALNGGDVKSAIITAAIPVVGKELAGTAAAAFVDAGMDQALAQSAGNVVAGAGISAAQGKDPLEALISGGISAGTAAITRDLPGFSELPDTMQRLVNAAVAAELSGGDASQATINTALNAGLAALRASVKELTPLEGPFSDAPGSGGGAPYTEGLSTAPDNIDAGGGWNPADVPDTTPDNIDFGGGWNPADVTPHYPDYGVPTQEEQQPAIDDLLKELEPYAPPVDDVPEMVITAPRPEDDPDNIDFGGGWNPADVPDTTPDNIDAGGGWNPADVPGTTTGGGATTPPKPPAPPVTPPTQPPAQQPAQPAGMDMLSLLGLMGLLGGQSAPAQPVQTLPADVKSFEDLGYGDLFGPKLQFSEGGDIDALIQLLRG